MNIQNYQHQYYHTRPKNHRHICIIRSFSTEKFFKTLPKHNGAAFTSGSFALNLYISTPLASK